MTSRKKHWTIRELKRSRGWMLSLFFAVCSMAVLSSLWFLINSFIEYGLRIKINNEYTAALSMERLYEGGMKSLSSEEVYRLLDAQGSSYLIKDGSGKILHEHGIEHFKGKENFLKEYKDIEGTGIWFDPKEGFLYYGEDGEPKIDILEFAKTFSGYLDMAAKLDPSVQYDERGDIEQDKDDISKDIRSLKKELKKKYDKNIGSPLWISIDVKSRDETFFCHRVVEASLWDIIFFSAIMALIMNLIFWVFLIVVAFTLRQFFNHKRTLRLFFTDNITLGNNFMW
ncbi:MAG: hypothetical protein K5931_11015, partial [Lachnospiraceae bacterium]|nr:hypothetical protein [Lachnospiraceae bacterium]